MCLRVFACVCLFVLVVACVCVCLLAFACFVSRWLVVAFVLACVCFCSLAFAFISAYSCLLLPLFPHAVSFVFDCLFLGFLLVFCKVLVVFGIFWQVWDSFDRFEQV